jgi:hypothetical protein
MNDIFIIDDVIPKDKQDFVEKAMFSKSLFWTFFEDVALSKEETKLLGITKKTPAIGCYIKQEHPPYFFGQLYYKVEMIPRLACQKINLEFNTILDARSFLMFPLHDKVRKEYDNIHVDRTDDHWVCLYYVNDSDGDTVLFKQTREDMNNDIEVFKNTKFEPLKTVTPKKGRAIVFNGNRYHSSTAPTEGVRCILNFDFK